MRSTTSARPARALAATTALTAALVLAGCGNDEGDQPQAGDDIVTSGPQSPGTGGTDDGGTATGGTGDDSATGGTSSDDIGLDEATRIALEDAGVAEADATIQRQERDQDDGRVHYEIEFSQGGVEYDYEIDAATGDIISSDRDD
ncbi:hypothetical protein DNL40_09750 [Xylanimonas oleitrophica]|uniref:PepSY domain-containing protein n=1 Tax=Xylanimonas oleitrophica TaxID=2607479 RepID=A0A2W5XSP9_9MICO|nr:PepSY domain-containing protein [Xylanimonas oleitrophica]PZR52928.1 hypothetical protein DNL40_09750 [Xylanimonas oleitrophica]